MIVVLQRVTQAHVTIEDKTVGQIGKGLMVLVCAERGDTDEKARLLAQRLLRYRVFEDENGKMNLSVTDVKGGLLLVSQFTLPIRHAATVRVLRRQRPPMKVSGFSISLCKKPKRAA